MSRSENMREFNAKQRFGVRNMSNVAREFDNYYKQQNAAARNRIVGTYRRDRRG